MTPRQMLVDPSKYWLKCPNAMSPEFIVIHNTANDASADNEISYMRTNSSATSFHFAIDDVEVVQGLPLNRNGWHAGDGGSGNGNRKGIGIEICYSRSGGERFIKAEQNAARFTAQLLKERGWGIDRVKKHQDFMDKYCPHRTLDMGWGRFLGMVQSHLTPPPPPKQQPNLIAIDIPDKIYVTTKDTNLWDLGFSSWGDAKSVKVLPKGTQIEVSATVDHPLGGRYMVSKYSYSKGIMNGVNVADIVEYKSPAVPKPPEPETPVVSTPEPPQEEPEKQPPVIVEPTPNPSTDPKDDDLNQLQGRFDKLVGILKTFIDKIIAMFSKEK